MHSCCVVALLAQFHFDQPTGTQVLGITQQGACGPDAVHVMTLPGVPTPSAQPAYFGGLLGGSVAGRPITAAQPSVELHVSSASAWQSGFRMQITLPFTST